MVVAVVVVLVVVVTVVVEVVVGLIVVVVLPVTGALTGPVNCKLVHRPVNIGNLGRCVELKFASWWVVC